VSARPVGAAVLVLAAVLALAAVLWGALHPRGVEARRTALTGGDAAAASSPTMSPSATPSPTTSPSPTPAPAASAASGASVPAAEVGETAEVGDPADLGVTAADRAAGVLTSAVPQRGRGSFARVPGTVAAPGRGRVYRVRVEVEKGLDVDGEAFADFALATLNDDRSWGHGGKATFSRTAGAADIRIVLASPETSAGLCSPLITYGELSCSRGSAAILTLARWVRAIPDYGSDRTGYRRYLVNHEVGHVLGHGHVSCPGRGRPAPVMMQQTKGLRGCLPNSWPHA
jgi:hypothetical protein